MKRLLSLLPLAVLGACAANPLPGQAAVHDPAAWRSIATEDDRRRLRNWRAAWVDALAKARAGGSGTEIAQQGALLDPDAALPFELPPAGDYACRIIKLGAKGEGPLHYVAYPAFHCRIEQGGEGLRFAKLTGSQRPIGRLYPDTPQRMVFLGTLQLADETRAYAYGQDRERDMAGILERIGERRWRLALPYPHFESTIDVVELTPRT